jgi:prepilin peptidase dependent protein C
MNIRSTPMQQGFTLLEVMVTTLLLSLSLLTVMQYFSYLSQGFITQWQYRQAWLYAHNQLERYVVVGDSQPEPQPGWQQRIETRVVTRDCQEVTVYITPPQGQSVALSRWICR